MRTFFVTFPQRVTSSFTGTGTLFKLYNTHATMKLNITKVVFINTHSNNATGALQTLNLGRYTTDNTTNQANVVPVQADTSSLTNALSVSCGYFGSLNDLTLVDTFISYTFPMDELYITSVGTQEATEDNIKNCTLFSCYCQNTQPIVLNQNQGLALNMVASGSFNYNVFVEFYSNLS